MGKKKTNRPSHRQYPNMADAINEVADEINRTLNERKKDKYFESIVLLYSFIENLLKWLCFLKISWLKADKKRSPEEMESLFSFCKRLDFFNSLEVGLMFNLIDYKLYGRINNVRKERNDVIHLFWIYSHRGNLLVLRKKLEKLANVSNALVEISNKLTRKIGVEEMYEIMLWNKKLWR